MTPEAKEFEQKVLDLFEKKKKGGKITSGIVSHRKDHSSKDLAAGAETEERRDELEKYMNDTGAA